MPNVTTVERFPKATNTPDQVAATAQERLSSGAISSVVTEETDDWALTTVLPDPDAPGISPLTDSLAAETVRPGPAAGAAAASSPRPESPPSRPFVVPIPATKPPLLAPTDIAAEAAELGCDAAAVRAVCDVESAGGGFLPDGRPKILFEAHIFGRLTHNQYDRSHPNISAPAWNHALYGAAGAHQHDRLNEAISLDSTAALEAASWGMFQILGLNYGRCGFSSVEGFVAASQLSELDQLKAFSAFCRSSGLVRFLVSHDWLRFALGYNGPGEAQNNYHGKLAQAYARHSGPG